MSTTIQVPRTETQTFRSSSLPFWLSTILFGVIPFSIFVSVDYQFAAFDIYVTVFDLFVIFSVMASYLLWATRFASRRVENLTSYARSLGVSDGEGSTINLEPSRGRTIIASLMIWTSLIGLFSVVSVFLLREQQLESTFMGIPAGREFFVEHVSTIAYFLLVLSYFIWTFAESMYAIHKIGKLPLNLKPYTEDRTLGLRPFGLTSLKLTAVYEAFPIFLLLLTLIGGALQATDIILISSMTIVGAVFFFVPLLGIRRKLKQAKRTELSWVIPWHTRVIERLKNEPASRDALAEELQLVRSIRQDIGQIQTWPFDMSILSRLLLILVVPPCIGVPARLLVLLVLQR